MPIGLLSIVVFFVLFAMILKAALKKKVKEPEDGSR